MNQEIELILGTDIINYVFDGTKISLLSGAAAYGTCFGHVIMGPVATHQNESTHRTPEGSRLLPTMVKYLHQFNIMVFKSPA